VVVIHSGKTVALVVTHAYVKWLLFHGTKTLRKNWIVVLLIRILESNTVNSNRKRACRLDSTVLNNLQTVQVVCVRKRTNLGGSGIVILHVLRAAAPGNKLGNNR